MADSLTILSQQALTRDELATFLGRNHKLIKFFENLQKDVHGSIPDGFDELAQQVDEISASSFQAASQAIHALVLVARALQSAEEGPPPAPPQATPDPDEPPGMASLRVRVAVLERLVSELKEGPTP